VQGATAALDIDVRGLIVSPGFIDVHTHDDAALIVRPQMTPKLTQGVTTVIGQLTVGKYADVCVFDAASIRDSATFEQPTRPASGIHYVFVNGSMALANGTLTATRAGMVLLRQDVSKGLREVAVHPDG